MGAPEEMVGYASVKAPIPNVALRVPLPHGLLMAHTDWGTIILPHMPQRAKGMMSINWKVFNMKPADMPRAPEHCIDKSAGDRSGLASINKQFVLQILDFLRIFANGAGVEEGEPGQFHKVVHSVRTLERLYRELDPLCLNTARLCLEHRANFDGAVGVKQQTYRVTFLLNVLCMADMLRTRSDLQEVLLQASRLVVPPVMLKALEDLILDAKHAFPHKSTVSCWRLILDGSYMLFQRGVNGGPPPGTRYAT